MFLKLSIVIPLVFSGGCAAVRPSPPVHQPAVSPASGNVSRPVCFTVEDARTIMTRLKVCESLGGAGNPVVVRRDPEGLDAVPWYAWLSIGVLVGGAGGVLVAVGAR